MVILTPNSLMYFLSSGYYCEIGSDAPTPCGEGTYSNATRATSCLNCPEGHYCPLNTSEPIPCPAGYYCGANTAIATANPCPVGTYNNETGMNEEADCLPCMPG